MILFRLSFFTYFKQNILYEPDELLAQVLTVNMAMKGISGQWKILSELPRLVGKGVVRCAAVSDLNILLATGAAIIVFQNKQPVKISAPHHEGYLYSADMNKSRPLKTLWTLLTKGYVFKLRKIIPEDYLNAGDYIFLPENYDPAL